MKIIYVLILLSIPFLAPALELRFYGDVLLSRGIETLVKTEGAETIAKHIEPFFLSNALHVANLEGAVGNKSSCPKNRAICFSIDKNLISALNKFDIISLENNHSLDLGLNGLQSTIKELKKIGVIPLTYKNYSTVIETEIGNVALIAFNDLNNNREKTINDHEHVIKEIKKLRQVSTVVVVYAHWGIEFDILPTLRMKNLAKDFVAAGADLVVGAHTHVVGKVECIDGKPVIYSLGNFLFDQKYEATKKGVVLKCADQNYNLTCSLIGTETPMNSFLPSFSATDYFKENRLLAKCDPYIEHTWTGIFSKDKSKKILSLKRASKESSFSHLELYDLKTNKREIKTPPMPIIKLQPVDINSDGVSEVMLVQRVYSSLDNEVAKRIYIYSLENKLHALWRGSALSRPLLDALFIKDDQGQPLLIALHTTDSFLMRDSNKPGRIIMSYRWNGFGFSGVKEIKLDGHAKKISCSKGFIKLIDDNGVIEEILPVKNLRLN